MSAGLRDLRMERHASLVLAIAIILEAAGVFMWAGAVNQRVDLLERQATSAGIVNERLARLEAQAGAMRAQLDRIEARLDQR